MLDDPRFDGFEAPMEMFITTPGGKRDSLHFEVARLAGGWVPPEVKGTVSKVNHYPCINLGIPALSSYAVQSLKHLLVGNGEILPLRSHSGDFYFFNVTTVADVLDVENSALSWLKPGIIAGQISFHSFVPTALDKLSIFRIPQKPSQIFVTQRFVDVAFESQLTGMRFTKVWPVEAGAPPEVIEVPVPDVGISVAEATAQSVYLYVDQHPGLDHEQIAEQLRALLPVDGDHSFALGHLEYVEELDGRWRFAFSCSDGSELAKVIKEHASSAQWASDCRIVERLGRYDDARAPEIER
jgi:hypothetical protein